MAAADFVLDNSVAMRWALPDSNRPEVHQYADKVLGRLASQIALRLRGHTAETLKEIQRGTLGGEQ